AVRSCYTASQKTENMKKIKTVILAFVVAVFFACSKNDTPPVDDKDPDIDNPGGNPEDRDVLVWVDANSNVFGTYGRFSSKTEIQGVLDTLKDAGVTGLVVDVKGSSG